MYVKVENNKITKRGLPKTGKLSTGETVSNFHLLPDDILLSEGWYPLTDDPPTTDEDHRAVKSGYTIYDTYVEQNYKVEEILPPQVSPQELENRELKKAIKKYINEKISSSELNPLEYQDFIEQWKAGVSYSAGDIVKYKDKLYEVLQAHTSQSDWTPDVAVSLFSIYTTGISEWVQPTGSHDCYNAGDMVSYNNKIYKSLIDGNVWEPTGDYIGRLWELIE